MSQPGGTASGGAQDEPITGSVFDFLYHDARRVGSFLAQIDPIGLTTSVKQTEGTETSSNEKSSGSFGASIAVARGSANFEDQATKGARQSFERTYDPIWVNAVALLDMLSARQMIHDGLHGARIGQFVKVSGSLSMMDLTLWKGLWSVDPIRNAVASAAREAEGGTLHNRQQRRHQAVGKAAASHKPSVDDRSDLVMAVLGMMPHTVQAVLGVGGGQSVWCTLREDGFITPSSELVLKHGLVVAGRWTMVGILDALPNGQEPDDDTPPPGDLASFSGPIGSEIAGLMSTLTPLVRNTVGRPAHAYGITPLAIFRTVAA